MRKILALFVIAILSLLAGKGLYLSKDGFSTRRIHPLKLPASASFDEASTKALKQTFHYLGRGRQCFAFVSDDGQYVLKIPRTDIYRLPFWARALPMSPYKKEFRSKLLKQQKIFAESIRLATNELSNQTAILATHLGQSKPSKEVLTLVDALHCTHQLPLHKTPFILQYKKPILTKVFLSTLQQEPAKAPQILDALLDTIAERAKKGILNRDRSFLRNYGYNEGKAFQIDIGSFFENSEITSKDAFEKSFRDSTDPIREWLVEISPELASYFQEKRHEILLRSAS